MSQETTAPEYALRLSDDERQRYRLMAERARVQEADRWVAAGVVAGARVADVGCGPGAVLVELARLVGAGGEAVGVEPDPVARAAAEEELASAGVPWASVIEGTGSMTGLPESSYDAVMIRHVLFHLGTGAPAVVRHCAGLLRPGGHLYLVDTDAEAMALGMADPDPDALELRNRYREFQRNRGCDVSIGPRLGPLLLDVGLEITERAAWYNVIPAAVFSTGGPLAAAIPAMLDAGIASPRDVERWRAGLKRVAAAPGAVLFAPHFVAVGRRPA